MDSETDTDLSDQIVPTELSIHNQPADIVCNFIVLLSWLNSVFLAKVDASRIIKTESNKTKINNKIELFVNVNSNIV